MFQAVGHELPAKPADGSASTRATIPDEAARRTRRGIRPVSAAPSQRSIRSATTDWARVSSCLSRSLPWRLKTANVRAFHETYCNRLIPALPPKRPQQLPRQIGASIYLPFETWHFPFTPAWPLSATTAEAFSHGYWGAQRAGVRTVLRFRHPRGPRAQKIRRAGVSQNHQATSRPIFPPGR